MHINYYIQIQIQIACFKAYRLYLKTWKSAHLRHAMATSITNGSMELHRNWWICWAMCCYQKPCFQIVDN